MARRSKQQVVEELIREFRVSGNQDNAFDTLAAERKRECRQHRAESGGKHCREQCLSPCRRHAADSIDAGHDRLEVTTGERRSEPLRAEMVERLGAGHQPVLATRGRLDLPFHGVSSDLEAFAVAQQQQTPPERGLEGKVGLRPGGGRCAERASAR